ncbi:MAG: glycosyltransferase family 2 protein [Thermoanaerobaculales bacterium]|nr:glycosyltransferase family 2 protein [Thermoanaerobaculales bacterium]
MSNTTGAGPQQWNLPDNCATMPVVLEQPHFDVVIVPFSSAEVRAACLGAVRSMEPSHDRLVVLGNCSTDDSCLMAERAGAEVVRLEHNTGFTGGMNRALTRTDSPWVLLLNPDCAPQPDYVARLFDAALESPESIEIGSVTGLLVRAAGPNLEPTDIIDAAAMVVTPQGRHFDRLAGAGLDHAPKDRAWVFGGTGAATLFRRTALEDVAYPDGEVFPSSFFAYREDAELAWRLQWRAWRCLFVPEALAHHGRGFRLELGRRDQANINRLSVRNRFLLRVHCADLAWHLRCFPWWLMRDLVVVGACLTIERQSFPALLEAWRLRSDAWKRRRWVLSRSKASSRQVSHWFRRPTGRTKEVDAS